MDARVLVMATLVALAPTASAVATGVIALDGPCSVHAPGDVPACVICLLNPPSPGCFVRQDAGGLA